ncbi:MULTISPECIES: site-specific integrase [unclassified Shinella]|uniref:tyrosine-type recombinase/integrase n=1 Tax=unclassified Shinella TaxID=2643062 RepID=UPI00225CBBE6|nr:MULTISPECIES: site-specific integrase [unclassified Shinella]MCO5135977.1 site-specific integrase [Shinella sp.]MDC7254388.1 site-specific integrase [Shinella sp. YE25]CAI0337078.1 Tyr recombinase domain-containing protein [Rhizobiaceae bacterium]CAK7255595.1 Site-specific integrase [Shinella sp. WSC3-e]
MATIKISAATVTEVMASARPNKTTFYFDADLAGFGFYRTTTGTGTFFVEYRPIAGGAKKRLKLGRVGALKANEAREAARKAIAHAGLGKDLARGRADERASLTVKELVQKYVDEFVEPNKKKASTDFYKISLKKYVGPHLGTQKAVALARVDVQRAHASMTKEARIAANRAIKLLSAAYGWGAKNGYVPEGFNPASGIDLNKEEGRERFLSTDEMKRLGEALREAETIGFPVNAGDAKHAPKGQRITFHPSVTGAIRLIMLTGCRLREILHLRWDEVDSERGLLFLPDSKTGRKTVVLSTAALAVLKEMPRVGIYVVAGASAGEEDEKPRADLKKPWSAVTKRAGLDGLRIHDLRHSFASVGAWSGLGLPVIGSLLGHADVSTTQKYAHIADDAARRAADAIAGQIAVALEGK